MFALFLVVDAGLLFHFFFIVYLSYSLYGSCLCRCFDLDSDLCLVGFVYYFHYLFLLLID